MYTSKANTTQSEGKQNIKAPDQTKKKEGLGVELIDNRWDSHRIRQLSKQINSRPKNTPFTENKLPSGRIPVLQRLVVYDGPKPPEDMNIIGTLPNIESSMGTPTKNNTEDPDYSSHTQIGILAHGGPGIIRWKGSNLTGDNFVNQELRKSGKEIQKNSTLEMWPCHAGEESSSGANDSLIHSIRDTLKSNGITGVTVKGKEGLHVVLNDSDEHFIPKDMSVLDRFEKLRNHFLFASGFFSSNVKTSLFGGTNTETLSYSPLASSGTTSGTTSVPVTFTVDVPKNNAGNIDRAIRNLRLLYNYEKTNSWISSSLTYDAYSGSQKTKWYTMCASLRSNPLFQAIMTNVSSSWLELKSN